jgi:hypothetical protein
VVAVRHQDALASSDQGSFLEELFDDQPALCDDEDAE